MMRRVLMLVVGCLLASGAQAALVERDLITAGDALITYDDQTNLEWLDVDATLGLSMNGADASIYVQTYGFDHANSTQVQALYTSLGLTDSGVNYIASNYAGSLTMINFLGCTSRCANNNFPLQWGLFERDPFNAQQGDTADITLNLSANTARVKGFDEGTTAKTFSNAALGNYLVRTAVIPIPASVWLFGSALGLLGWLRKSQKITQI